MGKIRSDWGWKQPKTCVWVLAVSEKVKRGILQRSQLNEITNFKWDHADLYVHNVDFQKIVFYKNNHAVFSETVQLDKYGDLVSQYLFTGERDGTLYYKCSFESGKLQFVGKEKLELSGGFLYFYKPTDCVPNQVNPLK